MGPWPYPRAGLPFLALPKADWHTPTTASVANSKPARAPQDQLSPISVSAVIRSGRRCGGRVGGGARDRLA